MFSSCRLFVPNARPKNFKTASGFFRNEAVNERAERHVARLPDALDFDQASAFETEVVRLFEQLLYLLELEARPGADNLDDDAFVFDNPFVQVAHRRTSPAFSKYTGHPGCQSRFPRMHEAQR
jgi:hypothetical protein